MLGGGLQRAGKKKKGVPEWRTGDRDEGNGEESASVTREASGNF